MKTQILEQINSECQRLSDKPGPDDSWPTSASQDFDFGTKEGTAKSAMEAKQDGVGIIENVPPEQTVNDSLTSAGGVHKNYRSDMMSALELGEEEDVESPSLPESMSENPNKYVPHISGAVDQKVQSILNGQVEGADKNAEEDSITRIISTNKSKHTWWKAQTTTPSSEKSSQRRTNRVHTTHSKNTCSTVRPWRV
ncbi:uncharacterized protein LOC123588119 isoform X1 [Leopardus geoffroyi]|uniref:uncharacterized protein LOC123588119 isoform X1 n=1 Tax=Leopardus geoffroyi TaxID=46844 RepID=UPI001E2632F4|nr:uncharacterized protein LOC123588119 isoform X1 [Leopardus geoffroyi]